MVHRASYTDRQGRKRTSSRYYATLSLPGSRTTRVAGFPSKRSTEVLERHLETLAALRAEGERPDRSLQKYVDGLPERIRNRLIKLRLIAAQDDRGGTRLLADALVEFEGYIAAKGSSKAHARSQKLRAERVLVTRCGFQLLPEIGAEAVLRALAELRADGMGGVTSNGYRQACRSFTRWAARDGRLREDPLLHLEAVSAVSESNRRALTPEEQAALISITRTQPRRSHLSGHDRSLLYVLALQTGLRRGELLTLRRGNFDLDGPSPTVTVEHGHAKNRRTARIPLQAETALVMSRFLAEKLPAAPVFRATRHYRAAEVLEQDLLAAGIKRETDGGVIDFHALRVTFVTNLARAGVSLAQAQKLARHCDPKLTAGIYSRFGFDEDAAAIAKLPNLAAI